MSDLTNNETDQVSLDTKSLDAMKQGKLCRALMYVWTTIGVIVLIGVLVYLMNILSAPIAMLIWTLIIIFCLRGIVNYFQEKGLSRVIATTIAYVIMFAVLAGIGFLMFSPMFGLNEQFINIIQNIPKYISDLTAWFGEINQKYSNVFNNESVQEFLDKAASSVSAWVSSLASGAANTVVDLGAGIANACIAVGFALVVAFWILMELPAIGREAKRVIDPKHYEQAQFFHVTFTRIMGGYIKGTLLQCLIIGVCCGVLFAILSIPNAPALGVIMGTLNIIPIVGPWIAGAISVITSIFVSPLTALITLIGVVVIQQFVYTFVSPRIMANSVDIHPVLTLIAMMMGSAIGGAMSGLTGSLVGMLFSIPAVAVMKACFVYYFERKTNRRVISEDGVFFKGAHSDDVEVDPFNDATAPNKKMQKQTSEHTNNSLIDKLKLHGTKDVSDNKTTSEDKDISDNEHEGSK